MEDTKKTLPLEKSEKLKVYAILSALKTVPEETLKTSLALSLMVGYSIGDIIVGSADAIRIQGRNPEDYRIGCMQIGVPLEEVVELPVVKNGRPTGVVPVDVDKKTVEEKMIDNVRIMFNLVGTKDQKRTAEWVIKKFNDYVDGKKLSTK